MALAWIIAALGGPLAPHVAQAQQRAADVRVASPPPAPAVTVAGQDYKLGVADKIRVIVYNEPTLSGEFIVNANGAISAPLIGDVQAAGRTTTEVKDQIESKLSAGYLRDPRVSIDVLTFRPFYILGEVNKPGEYPYSSGLTVLNAVAEAEGFTRRANRGRVFIKHIGDLKEVSQSLRSDVPVRPGDTIRFGERYF